MGTDVKGRFEEAMKVLNYGERCHALAKLGHELASSGKSPQELEASIDALAGDPAAGAPAFVEQARLLVAKSAGCAGYGRKLLDHPSQCVRFAAVRSKNLLRPEDAKAAFLDGASSKKLKKFLLKCPTMPVDAEVLDHAWQLFGEKDRERFWELLAVTKDEELFERWCAKGSEMSRWLDDQSRVSFLPQLAQRFPKSIVGLVKEGVLKWRWYWMKDLLNIDPTMVLEAVHLLHCDEGSGPRKGYDPMEKNQPLVSTVSMWGWRFQPEKMLAICKEATKDLVKKLASYLMEITSTRAALTQNKKLDLLMRIWKQLPDTDKEDRNLATEFLQLVPAKAELSRVIEAMWRIADDVGRSNRQALLVGPPDALACTGFFKTLVKKLPADQAVDQFFRILDEYEAAPGSYSYVQRDVCKTADGKHDVLMRKVFERYLQKEGLDGEQAAKMFKFLLEDAKSRDVIQTAFGVLVDFLEGQMESGLFYAVVSRMKSLEEVSRKQEAAASTTIIPAAELPLPIEWVKFVTIKETAAPHVAFLLQVLHSGTGPTDLLGAMLKQHGQCFFWDCLAVVLESESGKGARLINRTVAPPKLELLKDVDVAVFTAVRTESDKGPRALTRRGSRSEKSAVSNYFSTVSDAKKKVNAKAPCDREAGYAELVQLAKKDGDQVKAWEDLFPFLLQRFNVEQEGTRLNLLTTLLGALDPELWEGKLTHLKNLRKLCVKARESGNYTCQWSDFGRKVIDRELQFWKEDAGLSELCGFGLELVAAGSKPVHEVLVQALVRAAGLSEKALQGAPLDSALEWVLKTSVPIVSEVGLPVSLFWDVLKSLAAVDKTNVCAERGLWEKYPFVATLWSDLLEQTAKQHKAADFVTIGIVTLLTKRQGDFAPKDYREAKQRGGKVCASFWWAPLECDAYVRAMGAIMAQMESGDIPAREASTMLAKRIEALVVKARKGPVWKEGWEKPRRPHWIVESRRRRMRREDWRQLESKAQPAAVEWVQKQNWDVPKHHRYHPLPWTMWHCRDDIAVSELRTLGRLLANGGRQVLWQVAEVAARVSGPEISAVLEAAIAGVDPRFEGMARCIARHFPYVNSALTKGESQDGSSDVLTPLLELWLADDGPRDERIGKLMQRSDFECFLFFGTSFSRHLSNARQDWLHRCILKLTPPAGERPEFYHYPRRGPTLRQVAQLRAGGSAGFRAMLRSENGLDGKLVPINVQMYLWHPDTQTEFQRKALQSTDSEVLALIPRAEHADSVAVVGRVLDRYPSEQTTKEASSDLWGWEVIQAAGAYSSIQAEVERRFQELPPPTTCDAVDDRQVEVLLTALGRADDAVKALTVLGRYAGKVKQAKEAVTKMIAQVSPPRARDLIRDVMLSRKAGVGLQVAGLKSIVDYQIPEPLELYRLVWRNGRCQRDVAGNVLSKVATSPEFPPDEVRDFFDFFDRSDQQDKRAYIGEMLLTQLESSQEWSLPYLPDVVSKLALLAGLTQKAMAALMRTTTHTTEVINALLQVTQLARLAERTTPTQGNPRASLLKDLQALTAVSTTRSRLTELATKPGVEDCDAAALSAYLAEVLQTWEDAERAAAKSPGAALAEPALLDAVLGLWAQLIRRGDEASWARIMGDMCHRLTSAPGAPHTFLALSKAVARRASTMKLGPEEQDKMLLTVGDFFRRLLDGPLKAEKDPKAQTASDRSMIAAEEKARSDLIFTVWTDLLALGCAESEVQGLLALCPEKREVDLAQGLVKAAVQHEKKTLELAVSQVYVPRTQKRPEEGWKHSGGVAPEEVKIGSRVSGFVTNSSLNYGVFVNFGCVKDGKLQVPQMDYFKYRVGDRVDNMVVNKVSKAAKTGNDFIELLPGSGEGASSKLSSQRPVNVARCAIKWLAGPEELRAARWPTLSKLLASAASVDADCVLSFAEHLGLLVGGGQVAQEGQMVRLVEELLTAKVPKPMAREALKWLSSRAPVDAVRLWPALLTANSANDCVELEDVQALLSLCESGGHRLPVISMVVARGLSDTVVDCLIESSLPHARLLALQALQDRLFKQRDEPPEKLRKLRADPCHIVRVAAQHLWVQLGFEDEEVEDEEAEQSDEERQ